MNIYESVVIFNVNLSDEALQVAIQKVKDQLATVGGELLKTDSWGRRKLAYEIDKNSHGHYILFTFRGPSSAASAMEAFYRLYEVVIKQMVVKLEKAQAAHVLAVLSKEAAVAAAPAVAEPAAAEPAAAATEASA